MPKRIASKELSADGNWYRLVEKEEAPQGWRTSRAGTQQEHFHFVPNESLELRFETTPSPGFGIWFEGLRVDFVPESRQMLPDSFVVYARNRAIRWLLKNQPARS